MTSRTGAYGGRLLPAVLLLAVAATAAPVRAGAEAGSFDGLARADAFRVSLRATGSAAEEITDTSGPSAQAEVNSLGKSEGFAGALYPGDTAATSPGLVASLLAGQLGLAPPDLPPYPLVARSQSPGQPKASASVGPTSLTAESTDRSSTGDATGAGSEANGNGVGRAVGHAAVTVDNAGKVVADAVTSVESFTVANVFRIGAVTASAHVESTAGQPTTRSSFKAEGATIAGVPVAITDKGLVLGGTSQPLPDSSPLATALKSAGIEVHFIAPLGEGGTVQSAGIDVTSVQNTPTGNTVTVTYSFGKARAEIAGQASALPVDTGAAVDQGGGETTPATGPVDAGPSAGVTIAPSSLGAVSPSVAPVASSSGTTVTVAPAPSVPSRLQPAVLRPVRLSTVSSLSFYLVLVIGAMVALSGSLLLRHIAVRLAWTS